MVMIHRLAAEERSVIEEPTFNDPAPSLLPERCSRDWKTAPTGVEHQVKAAFEWLPGLDSNQ